MLLNHRRLSIVIGGLFLFWHRELDADACP